MIKKFKIFESLVDIEIKKYIVIPSGPNLYFVLERTNINLISLLLETKHIYTYNINEDNIIKVYENYDYNFELKQTPENVIIFQSDDLQEVFDKLPLLSNTNKYNL